MCQEEGIICRAARNECDLAEYCDGTSDNCPADQTLVAGTPCVLTQQYPRSASFVHGRCLRGKCRSAEADCAVAVAAGLLPSNQIPPCPLAIPPRYTPSLYPSLSPLPIPPPYTPSLPPPNPPSLQTAVLLTPLRAVRRSAAVARRRRSSVIGGASHPACARLRIHDGPILPRNPIPAPTCRYLRDILALRLI